MPSRAPRVAFFSKLLGRRFDVHGRTYQVAGVVPDVPVQDLHEEARRVFYTLNAMEDASVHIVVQPRDGAEVSRTLRDVLSEPGSRIAVGRLSRMADVVDLANRDFRLRALLVGTYASTGLWVAVLGLVAVTARSVLDRAREFQTRVMLGASRADVFGLVLSNIGQVVAIGLLIGIALGATAGQLFSSLVHGVSPWDARAHVVPGAMLVIAAGAAAAAAAESVFRVRGALIGR